MKNYYTYITTNRRNGVLYIGMTNDLERRIIEHKQKKIPGFSKKYNTDKLIWFERFDSPLDTILREKQLKGWRREKKIKLIEVHNPNWEDLFLKIKSHRRRE